MPRQRSARPRQRGRVVGAASAAGGCGRRPAAVVGRPAGGNGRARPRCAGVRPVEGGGGDDTGARERMVLRDGTLGKLVVPSPGLGPGAGGPGVVGVGGGGWSVGVLAVRGPWGVRTGNLVRAPGVHGRCRGRTPYRTRVGARDVGGKQRQQDREEYGEGCREPVTDRRDGAARRRGRTAHRTGRAGHPRNGATHRTSRAGHRQAGMAWRAHLPSSFRVVGVGWRAPVVSGRPSGGGGVGVRVRRVRHGSRTGSAPVCRAGPTCGADWPDGGAPS